MKKSKFWIITLLIISLTGCTGINKNEVYSENNNITVDIESSIKEEKETNEIDMEEENHEFENITFPGLDFSEVTYLESETERDEKIEEAFSQFYDLERGRDRVSYYYNKIDLNGDGNDEIFVFLVGPAVSGSGGGSAIILQSDGDKYKVISNFTLVNTPVIVSEDKSSDWNNLIMYVRGGGVESFYSEMKHDGKKYPLNPSVQPKIEEGTKIKGTAIIANTKTQNFGIEFK